MEAPETRSGVELVRATAKLAHLEIDDEEARRLGPQFDRILTAFQEISRLDVAGAPEMTRGGEARAVVRDDEPRPSLPADAALANAPAREDGFYRVPKTVGGDA